MKYLRPLIVLLLLSCTPKPKVLSVYILRVERDVLNFAGVYERETNIDTIRALNDTNAYEQAVTKYYSHKIAENTAKNKEFKTHSFSIQDSSGLYIDLTLPKNVTDSIDNLVKTLSAKIESDLK